MTPKTRPCAFFCRHYERNLGKRWRKLGRPLAVLTSYLALIAVIVALFSFVLPQVVESIRGPWAQAAPCPA